MSFGMHKVSWTMSIEKIWNNVNEDRDYLMGLKVRLRLRWCQIAGCFGMLQQQDSVFRCVNRTVMRCRQPKVGISLATHEVRYWMGLE